MNDFRLFAKDKGVSMSVMDDIVKSTNNSLTPVVLEERKMNVVAMDVYSRMLYDRIMLDICLIMLKTHVKKGLF